MVECDIYVFLEWMKIKLNIIFFFFDYFKEMFFIFCISEVFFFVIGDYM